MNSEFWKTKLLARIHDPGEKAFVLFGDRFGHEGGTVRSLRTELFGSNIDHSMNKAVKWADWWAAAADRPQWPTQHRFDSQVRWEKEPILIHPLSGKEYPLKNLGSVDVGEIKRKSLSHFQSLIHRNETEVDHRRTVLSYWRFCLELPEDQDNDYLGELWAHLPADTRIPDHSIWDHLDLTGAFAGAFAGDRQDGPALLVMSIGPVQSFISGGRSTSDLWAASHLLSTLSWEAMKVVCEKLGPDSIIFPRLRGVPIVDHWLKNECQLDANLFEKLHGFDAISQEANPLFRASLPNRFVAIVPYSESETLASGIEEHLRNWIQKLGKDTLRFLLEKAEKKSSEDAYAHKQIKDQLRGFPEVNWAVVPFSLIDIGNKEKQNQLRTEKLRQAMVPFFGTNEDKCGFLDSEAWRILKKPIDLEKDYRFFDPNPGTLYPAIYDLAERVLAATKGTRFFDQLEQVGWRCSITGESEWLTLDKAQLENSYRGQKDTLWARISDAVPSLAKEGEHLGVLAAIKRAWPDLFASRVMGDSDTQRFVVSTHTMAIASHLEQFLESPNEMSSSDEKFLEDASSKLTVALPRRLVEYHRQNAKLKSAKRIPAALEQAVDDNDIKRINHLNKILFPENNNSVQRETYYALLMMDGDRMGQILSGKSCVIEYKNSFHSKIRSRFEEFAAMNLELQSYCDAKRAISPGRHIAISDALNDFSLHAVPEIVEINHLGRVIYAGGDDVLAMLPVSDLLRAMLQLRCAYTGTGNDVFTDSKLSCKNGFIKFNRKKFNRKIIRTMGDKASVSCGAVIAHHRTPLSVVLRELRSAEHRAKNKGGRDAFSLVIMKRSGGFLNFTDKWDNSFGLLKTTTDYFAGTNVSRRSVYGILDRLRHFPKDADKQMIEAMILDQLKAHGEGSDNKPLITELSNELADFTCKNEKDSRLSRLERFLSISEFLAREVRHEASNNRKDNLSA